MDLVKWMLEHYVEVLVVTYGLLNVINGVLVLIPGLQGEQEGGWLSKVRGLLDRVSLLTAKDGHNTVKMPGTASKPASK